MADKFKIKQNAHGNWWGYENGKKLHELGCDEHRANDWLRTQKIAARGGNKVWIELPAPVDKEDADDLCAKANDMLRKLGVKIYDGNGFRWSTNERAYHWSTEGGCYRTLVDRGEWFNLDFLSK